MCAIETKSEGSSEKSERITTPSRIITPVLGDQGEEADIEEGAASEEEVDDMPPTPNTVPIATSTTIDDRNCDEIDSPMTTKIERRSKVDSPLSPDGLKRRRHNTEEVASFNTSNRKSKNCATFYFKHLDTDSEADCSQPMNEESPNAGDDSSEEEWTYTANTTTTTATSEKQLVTMERRKTNVVVRLDFGETPRIERTENLRFVSNVTEKMEPALMERDEMNDEIPANLIDQSTTQENNNKDDESEENYDKTSIQKLIKEVEKLVREERRTGVSRTFPQLIFDDEGTKKSNHRAKYARIKEWLKLNSARSYDNTRTASQYWLQPLDSCDASGEYTTEESDVERHSVLSDDPHSNISPYRHFDNELNGLEDLKVGSKDMLVDPDKTPINERKALVTSIPDTSTPKVIMRPKQKTVNGPRPWSISCISHFGNKTDLNQTNDSISQFSISETALHQLIPSSCMKSGCSDVTGSRKSFDNSTSTLLEESINEKDGRVMRNSSLRRKKSRLRKKNLGRKSESSSDSVNANHHNHNNSAGSDGSSHNQHRLLRKTNCNRTMCGITSGLGDCQGRRFTTLVKSGSFSGCIAHQQLVERTIVSDPTPPFRLPCCCNSVHASTSETEEEERPCNRERAGCTTTYEESLLDTVLSSKKLCDRRFNGGDSDVEMNSLGNNSFSEQAWDNYQEKYMSEPYSEAPDVETARRLLEFGDDYRNFLDSQSDCASSMSAVPGGSPALPRNRMHHTVTYTTDDSDSDTEDIRNVVEKSQSQLVLSENLFLRSNGTLPEDHTEMESACRENLKCLHKLLESSNGSLRGEKYVKQVRGMIERWESLSSRVEEAQKANTLHRELNAMHMEFKAVYDRLMSYEIALDQPHVLDERINRITVELATLRDRKPAMLALNVSTHRLITDLGTSASFIVTALKDSVADLYRVWDETFQKGNQQLCALQAVQQFSTRLAELQCALQRDKDTLAVLDVALKAGATSEVASSVRHVARLLSEKQDVSCQNDSILSTESSVKEEQEEELMLSINGTKFSDSTAIGLTQEGGSLSDSGISDSGSEQELSERERRLAALRRLTRSLETQLIPGSEALVELWKRVEDAEVELRDLQRKCRELIVRTAASVETRGVNKRTNGQTIAHWGDKRKKDSSVTGEGINDKLRKLKKVGATDSGDPEDEPGTPRSWVWRILRAALPFQLALVALFCAACLLEPHCCEATNTLHFSMTPQLRYVRGPPPV